MSEHVLDASQVHRGWDRERPARLTIDPGDTVHVEVRQVVDGFLTRDATVSDVDPAKFLGHPLTGPIAIRGAEPGHVVEVHIESITVDHWGATLILPGAGLLPDDFDRIALNIWEFDAHVAEFRPGIEIPVEPFCGVMGCTPAAFGLQSSAPPRRVGGNLDCQQLTAGATLWLPVEVEGAHFSLGDAHAAQGDGEVCVTAIETGLRNITLRFELRDDRALDAPEFVHGVHAPVWDTTAWFATTGVESDLLAAARGALRRMITHLVRERGLSPEDAYILCSVAVDLRINEIVNAGTYVVSANLPEAIFVG